MPHFQQLSTLYKAFGSSKEPPVLTLFASETGTAARVAGDFAVALDFELGDALKIFLKNNPQRKSAFLHEYSDEFAEKRRDERKCMLAPDFLKIAGKESGITAADAPF
jgi:sulfite reductase alpha subunit-like flavoprotein